MNKKFLIAWLVLFVLYMAGGIVVHGVIEPPPLTQVGAGKDQVADTAVVVVELAGAWLSGESAEPTGQRCARRH